MKTILSLINILLALNTCLSQQDTSNNYKLKVAGLQMNVTNNISINKERILSGVKEASAGKAIFLVTPEGSLSGYRSQFNQMELLTALKEILTLAKELKIGLLLGTCFKNDQG